MPSQSLSPSEQRPTAHGALASPVVHSSAVVRVCATFLAIAATGTSAGIAAVAGWERGGQLAERLAWIFVGLVVLLSAHLIPALTRGLPTVLRGAAMVLWLGAMIATGYGHATFFVVAQKHAGEARAEKISGQDMPAPSASSGRDPGQVATERAQVERDLAVANAQKCRDICTYLSIRRTTLVARLNALNSEFDEAKRRERMRDKADAERDRIITRRDTAMEDPVTGLVAHLFNVTDGTVNLVVALSFGWLLEAVGCLAWLLALARQHANKVTHSKVAAPQPAAASVSNSAVTGADHSSVSDNASVERSNAESNDSMDRSNGGDDRSNVAGNERQGGGNEAVTHPPLVATPAALTAVVDSASLIAQPALVLPLQLSDLDRLAAGIDEGKIRLTVADIRRFFRCSQSRAMELRREFGQSRPKGDTRRPPAVVAIAGEATLEAVDSVAGARVPARTFRAVRVRDGRVASEQQRDMNGFGVSPQTQSGHAVAANGPVWTVASDRT